MIIFLILWSAILLLLFVRWKMKFHIVLENTQSRVLIQFLWWKWNKRGRFQLQSKKHKEKDTSHPKLKKMLSRNQWKKKIRNWLLQHLRYDAITIHEKMGTMEPVSTAYAIPVLSAITTIPLHFLQVNYRNFVFQIEPDYEHLIFTFQLEAIASFRIVDLIVGMISEVPWNH